MPSHKPTLVVGSIAAAGLLLLASCGGGSDTTAAPSVVAVQAEQQVRLDNQSAPANAYTATLLPVLSSGQPLAGPRAAMGTGVVLIDPQRHLLRASVTTTELAAGQNRSVTLSHAAIPEPANANPGASDDIDLHETAPGSGVWIAQQTLSDAQLTALQAGEYRFQLKEGNTSAITLQGQVRPALPGGPLKLTAQIQQQTQSGNATNTITNSTIIDNGGSGQITRQETQVSNVQSVPVDIITINGQPLGTDTISSSAQNNQTVRLTMLTNVLSSAQTQQVSTQQSAALAVSVVILDQINDRMRVSLTSLGADGTAAHVHQGTPGTIGPTLFSLAETAADNGIWSGMADLNAAQAQAILQGSYYLDLHTVAAPQGLLRGQILQQGGVVTISGQLNQVSRNDSNAQQEVTQGNSSVIQQ